MLETRAGSKSEAAFLRLFPAGKLVPVDITAADYERMAELVELYADWPLGGTDASLIAIAERLGVTKVATLDRRHFGPIQPSHTKGFTLLPETL
jgi:predicted nucleic acid-binding protein